MKLRTTLTAGVATLAITFSVAAQSVPDLINYQGRLTDQTGAPLATGNYIIAFQLWDAATGGNLIWGQQQGVSVQSNGAFNVILGSPLGVTIPGAAMNDLNSSFMATNRYLGITVVSYNGVATGSSEIAPRQQMLTVPYAVSAANAGIASSVVPGSISTASLGANIVQTTNLADASVTLGKMAPRVVSTNGTDVVPIGGVAISLVCGTNDVKSTVFTNVTNLQVTLSTSGRPVFLSLVPDSNTNNLANTDSYSGLYGNGEIQFVFTRNGLPLSIPIDLTSYGAQSIPPGSVMIVDTTAPAGTNTYTLQARHLTATTEIFNVRLLAYEF